MKLPSGDQALVDLRKLTEYSLNIDHEDGKHKAALFRDVLGLTVEDADKIMQALRLAAVTGDAIVGKLDRYGQRYVLDFELAGPKGKSIVRSAWIVRTGETFPRLVTCYLL